MRISQNGLSLLKADSGSDVQWAEDAVNVLVKVEINQNQFDALVGYVFKVGLTAFAHSTLLRMLNAGHYAADVDIWELTNE